MTPDPNTSAKVSRYKWEAAVYILLSAKGRAYFCKSIAIEIGGVSRYFSKVSGSGVDSILRKIVVTFFPFFPSSLFGFRRSRQAGSS